MKHGKSLSEKILYIMLHQSKIVGECIVFTGGLNAQGYGRIYHEGERYLIHRLVCCLVKNVSYKTYKEFHHTCENRACFNTNHVIPLTTIEHRRITHTVKFCSRGHEISIVGRASNGCCNACEKLRRPHKK